MESSWRIRNTTDSSKLSSGKFSSYNGFYGVQDRGFSTRRSRVNYNPMGEISSAWQKDNWRTTNDKDQWKSGSVYESSSFGPTPKYPQILSSNAPPSLQVNFLGSMHNHFQRTKFEEGLGLMTTVKDLEQLFGQKDGSYKVNLDRKPSWLIGETKMEMVTRIPKLNVRWDEDDVFEIQQQKFEPLQTFLRTRDADMRKLKLNIVTNRGVLKKLMILDQRHSYRLIIRKGPNNILWIRNPIRHKAHDSVDLSAGTTFEEYLSSECSSQEQKEMEVTQFYGIYHARVGGNSILYHAEIDGFKDTKNPTNRSLGSFTPKDFVEIKTISSATIQDESSGKFSPYFYKQRLQEWWAQCKLAGIEEIVCGILNESNRPYSSTSNYIQLQKVMKLRVSEFQAKSSAESQVWSEKRLIGQLDSALNELRTTCSSPEVQPNTDYTIYVKSYQNDRTGESSISVSQPQLLRNNGTSLVY